MASPGSLRRCDHNIIGVRKNFFELRRRHDFFRKRGVTFAGPGYAPDAHVESTSAPGELAADGTEAHNEQDLAIQLGKPLRPVPEDLLAPARLVLMASGDRKSVV